jgi:hypothetical protein
VTGPSAADIAVLPDDELQRLFGDVARAYAERVIQNGTDLLPSAPEAALSATAALVVAGQILRAAEISSFELASILNI